jgi:ketosteroid isomerase-like protein
LDRQASEAYFKGDASYFQTFLSDKFLMASGGEHYNKAAATKMIAGVKCDVKEGWKLDEPQTAMIDADTYVLTYKGTFDGTCTENGKAQKMPSPIRAATVFVRNGDKWQAVSHGENPIIDPKNPPPPSKPEASSESKPMANSNTAANSNANTTAAAPPAPTADANTEMLTKLHNTGWEAWKARDAEKLEDMTTANFTFLDPMGGWHGSKAEIIKYWTQDMKCEGVNTAKFGDGFATALSPTVELLTGKGTADGTCDGQKNGDLYTTAVYVKEGETWKLAFMMESLPGGM